MLGRRVDAVLIGFEYFFPDFGNIFGDRKRIGLLAP
jgi:hypothetical protein